jgi:hypothetical protein
MKSLNIAKVIDGKGISSGVAEALGIIDRNIRGQIRAA